MSYSTVTVTTPASSQDLASVAAVKTELQITASTDDIWLQDKVTEASQVIAAYCGRSFGLETVTQIFRLDDQPQALQLARYPVTAITSVTEDADLLTSDLYEAQPNSGLLRRLSSDRSIGWTANKVTVVYQAGYALPASAPAALRDACLMMVKARIAARTRDPLIKSEEAPDIYRFEYWVGGVTDDGSIYDLKAKLERFINRGRA
jgi:hypothetical protein